MKNSYGNNGDWIIEGVGTGTDDLYEFLKSNVNESNIRQALLELMTKGKAGTISIHFGGEHSCLCFLPMDTPYNWYLISILPESLLQQETTKIMQMIEFTLAVLFVALVLIAALLLSRQSMKNQEKVRLYREQLFQTILANVDFAFLLYSPKNRHVELVSDNVQVLFDLDPAQVAVDSSLIADRFGIPPEDPK